MRSHRRAKALLADERGAIALMTALLLVTFCALGAGAVDLGSLYWTRGSLQAAADAAALAGALDPTRAAAIVAASTATNGLDAAARVTSTTGTYTADPNLAPGSRFAAGGGAPNALRVVIDEAAPIHFLRVLLSQDTVPIEVQATAAAIPEGAFSAGTGLASLDAGVLNALLSGLLGTTVALSLDDYQALAQANLSLLSFSTALASRLGVTGGSYGDLLSSNVTIGDLVAAAESVAGATNPQAAAALSALGLEAGAGSTFTLSDLLDLGAWDARQLGSLNPAIETAPGLDLLDLIVAGSQVANGGQLSTLSLPLAIGGVASATLSVAVGEGAQSAPRLGLGPVGIAVHTAQTRLLLDFTLTPVAGLSVLTVQLPLYIELAEGTATLSAIACGSDPLNDATMTIAAAPGIATAAIGSVGAGQMTNFSGPVSPGPATIVGDTLLKVTASATASLAAPTPSDVSFSFQDIDDATVKTVSTRDALSGLMASLSSSLGKPNGLTVTALGLLPLPLGTVAADVAGALQGVLGQLDAPLDTLLSGLGLALGTMDLRATGMRCGVPVIVQ